MAGGAGAGPGGWAQVSDKRSGSRPTKGHRRPGAAGARVGCQIPGELSLGLNTLRTAPLTATGAVADAGCVA